VLKIHAPIGPIPLRMELLTNSTLSSCLSCHVPKTYESIT